MNRDMIHEFKESQGEDGNSLNGCIELLKKTCQIVEIFNDTRPVSSMADKRLHQITEVAKWLANWEKEGNADATSSEKTAASHRTDDIYTGV